MPDYNQFTPDPCLNGLLPLVHSLASTFIVPGRLDFEDLFTEGVMTYLKERKIVEGTEYSQEQNPRGFEARVRKAINNRYIDLVRAHRAGCRDVRKEDPSGSDSTVLLDIVSHQPSPDSSLLTTQVASSITDMLSEEQRIVFRILTDPPPELYKIAYDDFEAKNKVKPVGSFSIRLPHRIQYLETHHPNARPKHWDTRYSDCVYHIKLRMREHLAAQSASTKSLVDIMYLLGYEESEIAHKISYQDFEQVLSPVERQLLDLLNDGVVKLGHKVKDIARMLSISTTETYALMNLLRIKIEHLEAGGDVATVALY